MPTQPPLIPAAMLPLASILVSVSPDILVSVQDSALVVADTMQWAWVALPGLPTGTAPSLAGISATGLSPTSSLLVAAYGSSLFTITASQCGLGSYWNGLRCVPHTCVRVPQCDPTQRLVNNQCVCIPGYYSLQGSLCTPCPTGSYCSGGLKYTCPTGGGLTTLSAQSTSPNDCICSSVGYYYAGSSLTCSTCPANTWCPNRYMLFQCPGGAGSTTTTGSQFPVGCTCLPGYTGPSCAPCPASSYCPASATTVSNMAVYYAGTRRPAARHLPTLLTAACRGLCQRSAFGEGLPPQVLPEPHLKDNIRQFNEGPGAHPLHQRPSGPPQPPSAPFSHSPAYARRPPTGQTRGSWSWCSSPRPQPSSQDGAPSSCSS
jgi:hypothetical protein